MYRSTGTPLKRWQRIVRILRTRDAKAALGMTAYLRSHYGMRYAEIMRFVTVAAYRGGIADPLAAARDWEHLVAESEEVLCA